MKIDDATHMFREMPRKGLKPDVTTYTTILQGLFRGGRCSDALEVFDEMQAVGSKPNFYTYCNVLDGLCRNGRVERALLLLDALEHKEGEHLHITYYNIVMDGLCEGLDPDVVTYTILIKGCCRNGPLEEAKDILLKMEQASFSPDEITYNVIVRGNLRGGKCEDAEKLFVEMCDKGFSPDASTLELLLDLVGTTEQSPTIFKMIQKLAPNALKQKF
ncbi:putative pentatricopeptide repeat-containing protein at1g12700 mitochondrial [Phtheirospermum japonicum]|uniref:Putative pentatricopeptide repeat-containing protein at1g12700 mitochondrial n=1 Tax=Phtheirospermum japonicum TaxID=374723 RepID=A0A830BHC7_9LAMI|nr:putative pentatricopeptide repeat-containing protein at1g12700 mitochondrial [Phtheirospermum japonicum]